MRYERFDAEPAGVQGEGLERKRIKERNKPKRQYLNDTMHGLTLQILRLGVEIIGPVLGTDDLGFRGSKKMNQRTKSI